MVGRQKQYLDNQRLLYDSELQDNRSSENSFEDTGDSEFFNFMSTMKSMRDCNSLLDKYSACIPGPTLVVHFNNLVAPPEKVSVLEVTGQSVQLAWNFSLPKYSKDSFGTILVRPEVFSVHYWLNGTSMSTSKCKETKG